MGNGKRNENKNRMRNGAKEYQRIRNVTVMDKCHVKTGMGARKEQ